MRSFFGPRERLIGFDASEHAGRVASWRSRAGTSCGSSALSAPTSAMTRSISIAAVPPTGCRAAASALVSCASRTWLGNAWRRWLRAVGRSRDGQVPHRDRRAGAAGGAVHVCGEAVEGGGGAKALVVHARKAWLEGLSPKDNRSIPPLDEELVHALKRAHPEFGLSSSTAASRTSAAAREKLARRRSRDREGRLSKPNC